MAAELPLAPQSPADGKLVASRQKPIVRYGLVGALAAAALAVLAIVLRSEWGPFPEQQKTALAPQATVPDPADRAQREKASEAERAWAVTKDSTSIAVMEDFIRQFGDTGVSCLDGALCQEFLRSFGNVSGAVMSSACLRGG